MLYRIHIQGELDQSWSDWLGQVEISHLPSEKGFWITVLTANLPDQSALFGVLDRIRDLHLILISVNACEAEEKE